MVSFSGSLVFRNGDRQVETDMDLKSSRRGEGYKAGSFRRLRTMAGLDGECLAILGPDCLSPGMSTVIIAATDTHVVFFLAQVLLFGPSFLQAN